ncbi:hypothetical protein ACF0H5_003520 [Mactra antiquata]
MKKVYRKLFQTSAYRINRLVKNKYKVHEGHRLVLMNDQTWKRWSELRKLLNLGSNCKLAELLINAWYGRQLEYEHAGIKSNRLKINSSYEDHFTASNHDVDFHDDNVLVKTEPESDNSGNESGHKNLDESYQLADTRAERISVSTVDVQNHGERMSTRLKVRGVRPNYASIEHWNEDSECGSESDDRLNQSVSNEKKYNSCKVIDGNPKINVQRMYMFNLNRPSMKESLRSKKRKPSEDPDFLADELGMSKDTSGSENGNVGKISDSREKMKRKRTKKSKTKDDDEWEDFDVKKLTRVPREKVDESVIEEPKQKPWISIKLEDHPEKYRIESVGSFERKNRGSNIVDELYTCLLCGRFKSSGKQIFEEHIEKHVNGVLQCPQCNYSGRSEVEIANHQMEHGHLSKGRKYVCDLCGVVLYSSDSRLSHMGRVHGDPRFKCKYCGMKSTTRLKRLQHIRNDHPDIAQHCIICKRDFRSSTAAQFKAHISTCKPGYTCQVCGHVFTSKTGLSNHIKHTHMNIRKYQCHMCPYAGKSAKRLKEHIMTHTGSHPYSCDQCSFTCVQAYQLTSHQRTHTGDKPYKCTQCNFAAAWNVQLKDHVKVHSMNTSVLCEPCNIFFKNDKARKMHEKKDHEQF